MATTITATPESSEHHRKAVAAMRRLLGKPKSVTAPVIIADRLLDAELQKRVDTSFTSIVSQA